MKISVRIITRAKQENVVRVSQNEYKIWVRYAREKGRANQRAIELLSEHFARPKSAFVIVKGKTASKKIIEISSQGTA